MPESPPGGVRATAVAVPTGGVTALVIPGSGNAGPVVTGQVPPGGGIAVNNIIRGVFNYTNGASGTGVTIKCFRGPNGSGTQVGTTQSVTLAASALANIPFEFQDLNNPVPQSGYSIVLTAVALAGTANEIVASIDDGS
jgi:hypothetical protein